MREITVDDYTLLQDAFQRSPYRLSVYSLPSLIVWSNPPCRCHFCREDDGLVVLTQELTEPEDGRCLLLPVGGTAWTEPERLYRLAQKWGCLLYTSPSPR
ncbi:MAG: hypothetical protein N2Z74_00360, partial [Syntrophales bacterium]|nr:hypothetical protein [Syntrophales bacterium]